jgi:transposase
MASITKKKKGRGWYYYIVESKRVRGKPRIVWQKYLGTIKGLLKKLERGKPPKPVEHEIAEFGGVAALLCITEKLHLLETINKHVPKREQGPTVGHYMILAAINRALAPKSKSRIGEWYEKTILPRLWRFQKSAFSSKRFWDHMELLDEKRIRAIEIELMQRILSDFGVEPKTLLIDFTNFLTFIDTFNARCGLAQRGNAKAKRRDLRIVGLALVVTKAFHIPMLHQTYAGNINDVTQFHSLSLELARRYKQLCTQCEEITLVFDKGNSSRSNIEGLAETEFHFVCALSSRSFPRLIEVPLEAFESLDERKFPGVRVYRTTHEVFGTQRTILITFSDSFYSQQLASFTSTLTKSVQKLQSLSKDLLLWHGERKRKGGNPPTVAGTKQRVADILSGQHMKKVIHYEIREEKGLPLLSYSIDRTAIQHISERLFGKTFLFTDNEHWSNEEILSAYRGLAYIESAFKNMKNHEFLRWQPPFHWTDQKLKVHSFYCVLALTLCSLLRKLFHEAGLPMSIPEMLGTLQGINETVIIYPPGTRIRQKDRISLSKMDADQKRMFEILSLAKFTCQG